MHPNRFSALVILAMFAAPIAVASQSGLPGASTFATLAELPPEGWFDTGRLPAWTCVNGKRCATLVADSIQTVDAVAFRGHAVLVTGMAQSLIPTSKSSPERPDRIGVIDLQADGLVAGSATISANLSDVTAWIAWRLYAYVDEDADTLSISVQPRRDVGVVIRDVVVRMIDPASANGSWNIARTLYFQLDASVSSGTGGVATEMLVSEPTASMVPSGPFQTRRGATAQRSVDVSIAARTLEWSLLGSNDDELLVRSRVRFSRVAGLRRDAYDATFLDVWIRRNGQWRLVDAPALSVRAPALDSHPHRTIAAATSLCGFAAPVSDGRSRQLVGEVRALVVFVDFENLTNTPDSMARTMRHLRDAAAWIDNASGGGVNLRLDIHPQHIQLSGSAGGYATRDEREVPRALFRDLKDPFAALPIGGYSFIYVVTPPRSGTWTAAFPGGATAYSLNAPMVLVGANIQRRRHEQVLAHETLHVFGLPDLYFESDRANRLRRSAFPFGGWDIMSDTRSDVGMSSWHRGMLGWLDEDQVRCVYTESATETLRQVGLGTGLSALVVPLTRSTAIVAELREAVDLDVTVCREGVLVYKVDTAFFDGIAGSFPAIAPVLLSPIPTVPVEYRRTARCVGENDVPLTASAGSNAIQDRESGVRIQVDAAEPGAYRVTVSRTTSAGLK